MLEYVPGSIQGFVKIKDPITHEILRDTHNDVLYGNVSTALAYSLIGNPNGLLSYMAFGNGGAYVDPTGLIKYKPSIGGPQTTTIKTFNANLYNTVYVKAVYNSSTSSSVYNPKSAATIPNEDNTSTNYEDIIVDVVLNYNEPNGTLAGQIQQAPLDNSTFIGTAATIQTPTPEQFVFNEIGLFSGSNDLFVGPATTTYADVNNFVNQGFSTAPNTKSKLMLTHVVFHPVQKAADRAIEVIYTLRIQIGAR